MTRHERIRIEIARAVAEVSGRRPSARSEEVSRRVGEVVLSEIQVDFLTKSRGGTGRDGITWKPLAAATLEERLRTQQPEEAERRKLTQARRAIYDAALTSLRAQSSRSFAIYQRIDGATDRDLQRIASERADAWADAERKRLQGRELTASDVEILRATGEMYESFGVGSDSPDQVFDVGPGFVRVGSKNKPWHQKGGPRLPARPVVPTDGVIPEAYWPAIADAVRAGIKESLFANVASGRIS